MAATSAAMTLLFGNFSIAGASQVKN